MNDQNIEQQVRRSPACETWIDELLVRMFRLMHSFEQDNFASDRYQGTPPTAFFADQHAAYLSFVLKNAASFYRSRELMVDEASRALFDQLILFRILGHLHVRLPFNTPEAREYQSITDTWKVEDTQDTSPFGPLAIYAVPLDDMQIRAKCWGANVAWTFLFQQYYFDRDGEVLAPATGDHIIDAGGCFGDTALGFARTTGKKGHVYTFDPLQKHCAIMRESFAMNPILAPRISIFEIGLSDQNHEGSPPPATEGVINPGANIIGSGFSTRTIDSLVTEGVLPRIDFIKMDVEGSELLALAGAEASLRRWRPRLAISLYHRPEDFFTIPLWLDSLGIGYRFFLEHYSIHHEETVLFARV